MQLTHMPQPPASGDLSHPELLYTYRLLNIDVPVKHKLCDAKIVPWQVFDLSTSKWSHG